MSIYHIEGVPCPLCSDPEALFSTVHVPPPPCYMCGSDFVAWTGKLSLECLNCHHVWETDGGI